MPESPSFTSRPADSRAENRVSAEGAEPAWGGRGSPSTESLYPPVVPPPVPRTLEEMGLPRAVLESLLLKTLYVQGTGDSSVLSEILKISPPLVAQVARPLASTGSIGEGDGGRLLLTDLGRQQARDAFAENRYLGPAPVSVEEYVRQCRRQVPANGTIPQRIVRLALEDLILGDDLIESVAAALSLGRSMLFYGPRGNGKSEVARRIASLVREEGGAVFQPRSLLVDREIRSVFDPAIHTPVESPRLHDPRWIPVRRPIVTCPASLLFWTAAGEGGDRHDSWPLGLRANGGVLLVDPVSASDASELADRWQRIRVLEGDALPINARGPVRFPLASLIVATTRSEGREALSPLSWQSQIEFSPPTRETSRAVFLRECDRQNLPYREQHFDYLWHGLYGPQGQPSCRDPRDLLHVVRAISRSREVEGDLLTADLLRQAARQLGWKVPPSSERGDRRRA